MIKLLNRLEGTDIPYQPHYSRSVGGGEVEIARSFRAFVESFTPENIAEASGAMALSLGGAVLALGKSAAEVSLSACEKTGPVAQSITLGAVETINDCMYLDVSHADMIKDEAAKREDKFVQKDKSLQEKKGSNQEDQESLQGEL
eukprot:470674-Ditylum_brightwellii.AAC.1